MECTLLNLFFVLFSRFFLHRARNFQFSRLCLDHFARDRALSIEPVQKKKNQRDRVRVSYCTRTSSVMYVELVAVFCVGSLRCRSVAGCPLVADVCRPHVAHHCSGDRVVRQEAAQRKGSCKLKRQFELRLCQRHALPLRFLAADVLSTPCCC
jgi:hypothetical protein